MELDGHLRALAERQHGVIARAQARSLEQTVTTCVGERNRWNGRRSRRGCSAWWAPSGRTRLFERDVGGDDWIGRIDFLDTEKRLVVEVDSDLHHSSLLDEDADAARDTALAGAGYTVVRINEGDLWHRPEEVVRRLLAS